MCNGCCLLAGLGMDNAKEERAKREAAFHEKAGKAMDAVK
jgi:hypothetical protein